MRTLLIFLVACGALAAGAADAAEAGLARNGHLVRGGAEGFEVFPTGSAVGTEVFCAAGDFARRRLGARAIDRVEIIGAIGPSRTIPTRRSVVFAVRPAGSGRNAGLDTVLLRPGRVGVSRSVAAAESLCNLAEFGDED